MKTEKRRFLGFKTRLAGAKNKKKERKEVRYAASRNPNNVDDKKKNSTGRAEIKWKWKRNSYEKGKQSQ